ncbi:MAG: nucleotidyltransferase family protein [Porphyrobacter sp.]|nr:nucleotidyltransferase family protein [Porphyrobacter sp.]
MRGNDLKHGADLDAVDAYLAACLRHALAHEAAPAWPGAWSEAHQHQALLERCQYHGIANILAGGDHPLAGWPRAVSDPLRFEARLAAVWEESHRTALMGLLARLADAGVAVTVMKGTALAYLAYDQPAMRRRGDTDLLIDERDLERARAILAEAGFSLHAGPHGLYCQETWRQRIGQHLQHVIDLHWQPTDRPVLQRILRFEDFFRNRVPVPGLGPAAFAPSPVQMLMQGAVNQAWHTARGYRVAGVRIVGGMRLVWQVDNALLVRQFDDAAWDELLRLCRARDARSIVYAALAGMQADLHRAIPEAVMAQLRQSPESSRAHSYIRAPETALTKWSDINLSGSMWLRLRIMQMAIFPPRDHLVTTYPRLSHWPTPALQLRRYWDSVRRVFRRLAAR